MLQKKSAKFRAKKLLFIVVFVCTLATTFAAIEIATNNREKRYIEHNKKIDKIGHNNKIQKLINNK
jgi:hypothetical protein